MTKDEIYYLTNSISEFFEDWKEDNSYRKLICKILTSHITWKF
jgi:hypothetical protein